MKLLVINNLMIVPSMDVYIMINTAVKYTVKKFRQNSVIGKRNFESINHILYIQYSLKKLILNADQLLNFMI